MYGKLFISSFLLSIVVLSKSSDCLNENIVVLKKLFKKKEQGLLYRYSRSKADGYYVSELELSKWNTNYDNEKLKKNQIEIFYESDRITGIFLKMECNDQDFFKNKKFFLRPWNIILLNNIWKLKNNGLLQYLDRVCFLDSQAVQLNCGHGCEISIQELGKTINEFYENNETILEKLIDKYKERYLVNLVNELLSNIEKNGGQFKEPDLSTLPVPDTGGYFISGMVLGCISTLIIIYLMNIKL